MNHIAIKFENISKQYRLGLVSTRTLSHDLNRWWKVNVLRREDPYLKIGEVNDRSQKGESEYVWALRDINFDIEQGDVVGIIGKNGAGKSTLLKILSRVTTPTTGTIKAKGRIASLLEVGTGFHPEMTGRENIYMNGAIMGMTKQEIARKLDEIVDFSGIERYLDTPVKRYSSGMTVRLGFAIAAHLDPEILVVDEVLAVGDAEFQKKAIGKMQDVSRGEGRTVLFVSHNMAAVKSLCTKGVLIENGMVKYQGSVEETLECYLTNKYFQHDFLLSSVSYLHKDLILKSITVNGSDVNYINLKNSVLEINLELYVSYEMPIAVEFALYDANNNLFAYFSPGHLYGEVSKYPKGFNVIHELIQLPDNLNNGEFYMDLYLTIPNIQEWLIAKRCLVLKSEGIETEMGDTLSFSERGYLFLRRKNEK